MMNDIQKNYLVGQITRVKQLGMKKTMMKGQDVVHSRHLKKLQPTLLEPLLCKSINQKLKPIYY